MFILLLLGKLFCKCELGKGGCSVVQIFCILAALLFFVVYPLLREETLKSPIILINLSVFF